MLKRLSVAFAAFFVLATSALGAGTIPLSLTQRVDQFGKPLSGGKLYFIQAGTVSTPQNAYQDFALTIPWPNPITLDVTGFIPQFFLADGQIKIRLTDKNGVTQVTADNILVIGPSSGGGGGGGGGTVDPTTIFQTGDTKIRYDTAIQVGWVRENGRTIGNASSGATERANADTQALFIFLWSADTSLPVSGGRGASGAVDFAANKTINLPDFRGRVLPGFDDMGNSAASRLTTTVMNGTGIGAVGGTQTVTLTLPQLPPGITSANLAAVPLSVISTDSSNVRGPTTVQNGTGSGLVAGLASGTVSSTGNIAIGSVPVTSNNTTGQPHITVQPSIFVTYFIKL